MDILYVQGKTMRKKISRAIVDFDLVLDQKQQTLYSDVMHVDGSHFLVTFCEPLHLTLQVLMDCKWHNVLRNAL